MTTFVKATDRGISVPILASDNTWYGKNIFLGSVKFSDASFGGVSITGITTVDQINCSGLGSFNEVVVNTQTSTNNLLVNNLVTTTRMTVVSVATVDELQCAHLAKVNDLQCTNLATVNSLTVNTQTTTTDLVCNNSANIGTLTVATDAVINGALMTSGLVYENMIPITGGTTNAYTLNYFTGGLFYIPSNINPTANSTLTVTSIPLMNSCYTFTVISYQASTRFFINQVKIQDKNNAYILGSSGGFATPLFNGGVPVLSGTTPGIIIQQFTIVSFGATRYVTSSVSACT